MLDLLDKTKQVVENFCNNLESFTSLDVSNIVKKEGFEFLRHRDIAQAVRNLYINGHMDNFGYCRSLVDVTLKNGDIVHAYLYHHQTVSSDLYDKRNQDALPPVSPTKIATNNTTTDTICVPTSGFAKATISVPDCWSTDPVVSDNVLSITISGKRKPDGRIEVPQMFIKALGWMVGDIIKVDKGNNGNLVLSIGSGSDEIIVDKFGRLRITKSILDQANITGSFTITLENGNLSVASIVS